MPDQYEQRAKSRREALLALLTGAVAEPAAGLSGLYGLITGGASRGAQNVERTREALTYQPRDPSALQALGRAVEPVTSRLEALRTGMGDQVMDRTGKPGLATAAYMVPDTLLTLLGARSVGVKGPKLAQMVERSQAPTGLAREAGAIGAWHGSPHDFDRFDMSRIGTGEGAQAYGHGLYFAGNKEVAGHYQSQLAGAHGAEYRLPSGEVIRPQHPDVTIALDDIAKGGNPNNWFDWTPEDMASKQGPAIQELLSLRDKVSDGLERLPPQNKGRLYEVELAPDETDLLDWDAPLSEQPEKVRKALESVVKPSAAKWYGRSKPADTNWASYSGPDGAIVRENLSPDGKVINYQIGRDTGGWDDSKLHGNFATLEEAKVAAANLVQDTSAASGGRIYAMLGEPPEASSALRQLGIPGLRYLDGGSRAAGDGTRNYVIFDDSLVKIRGKE